MHQATMAPLGELLRDSVKTSGTYHFGNSIQHLVNQLLAHGVVAASIVVGSVLFTRDHLLRMEELSVGASANLICIIDTRNIKFETWKSIPGKCSLKAGTQLTGKRGF